MIETVDGLSELPEPAEGRTYLAMVPHGWGRDQDAKEAFRIARSNGAYFGDSPRAGVWNAPADVWVDQMGTIRWEDGTEVITMVANFNFKA